MKLRKSFAILLIAVFAFVLQACQAPADTDSVGNNDGKTIETKEQTNSDENKDVSKSSNNDTTNTSTVEISDVTGTVTVPVNPKKVISLDNRTFETLSDWGVKLVAAPLDVMPPDSPYKKDSEVLNIGNHREPNLEILAAADPDLVIVGQRFASYYDEIKALVPNATVINLNIDVSEKASTQGENLIKGFENYTIALGKIFDKNTEAQVLVDELKAEIEGAKKAYKPEETVMSVVISGGEIGYSAPGYGRVWGPIYQILNLTPSLGVENATSDHQGDDISVEAIAQSNPDWLFVLDRDASTSSSSEATYVSATDVLSGSKALSGIKAMTENHIVNAPADTYTNESIQTYIEIFKTIKEALSK